MSEMNQNDPFEHLTIAEPPVAENVEAEDEGQIGVELPFDKLFDYLQRVLEEGTARRVILRDRNARVLLDVPLGPSALFGAVGFMLMPLWMRIVTVVGVLSSITVEIQREVRDDEAFAEGSGEAPSTRKQRITIERDETGVNENDVV